MSKFCANLQFLFKEKPLLERYATAQQAGFRAVETGFPTGYSKQEVFDAKNAAGIEQVLISTMTGDVGTEGELGFTAIPGKENEFKESIQTTVEYAKALGAKKIHITAGRVAGEVTVAHDNTYMNNLKYASKLLEKEGLLGLIEPINKYSLPKYYMNSYEKAIKVLDSINSPNLKLQLDIFHLQMIKGNITNTIKELKSYIGHVQIAQAPNRNEPNTPGEINYKYVFDILREEGYNDWISLEYTPKNETIIGLKWIQEMGYSL